MKIRIEGSGRRAFTLTVPALWAVGRVGALFIRAVTGVRIRGSALVRLRRIIRRYKKASPEWTAVEVRGADGARIGIKI